MDDLEINRRVAEVAGVEVTEESGHLWLDSSKDMGIHGWLEWCPTWNGWQCMELQERFNVETYRQFDEINGFDELVPGYWEAIVHWESEPDDRGEVYWYQGLGATDPSLKRAICLAVIDAHDQGAVDE